MSEEWKMIPGYEGLYEVSNMGRVRSLDRITTQINNGTICKTRYKGKVLKGREVCGYIRVHVSKDGCAEALLVHRLVAECFCEKPKGCNIVNHLDCNPQNNKADNLEWTTYSGNMQWASALGHMRGCPDNLKKAHEKRRIPVIATSPDGTERVFASATDACRLLNIPHARKHVAACCRKDYGYKTAGGYEWRYA